MSEKSLPDVHMSTKAQEFRSAAERAERKVAEADRLDDKLMWHDIADQWRDLAARAERAMQQCIGTTEDLVS